MEFVERHQEEHIIAIMDVNVELSHLADGSTIGDCLGQHMICTHDQLEPAQTLLQFLMYAHVLACVVH
eukprot:6129952-Prorocentrum_lima.AAC.1